MSRIRRTQKQTPTLIKLRRLARYGSDGPTPRTPHALRKSSILFVSLAATAGISTLAFGLQHDGPVKHQSINTTAHSSSDPTNSTTVQDVTLKVENSQATSTDTPQGAVPTVQAEATINNEVIPLTDGSVERSFTDSNGNEHTVTISIDGESTVVESSGSSTYIDISTSSSSSNDQNTTRGSPHR